jgi:hypothetical protein
MFGWRFDFGPVGAQYIIAGGHGRGETFKLMVAGNKETGRTWGPNIPFKSISQMS